jgi:hypothetical protein
MKKRIVGLLAVLILVISAILVPAIASADTTATVSIGATPSYLCMTLTFNDAHDGSWAVGTVAASTTYWWDDESEAQVSPFPGALAFADCAGNITNCGSITSDITVECADFTGGVGWNLTTGAPGENTVQVTAYMEGCADEATGTEVDNAPVDLHEDITAAQSLGVELSLETGTFTDGVAKASTGVVFTITATD